MNPFQEVLHDFVQASNNYSAQCVTGTGGMQASAEREMARAGDALEGELRRMMREEANASEARRAVNLRDESVDRWRADF